MKYDENLDQELMELEGDPEFEQELAQANDELSFAPVNPEKKNKYLSILKTILPHLGSDEAKIIITEIMLALKVEGVIGKKLSKNDTKLISVLRDSVLHEPSKRQQALNLAQKLLQ